MTRPSDPLSIGDLAERSGVATSALRFYESRGLIHSTRTSGNQRRYPRSALRRVAFIRAAQRLGLSLEEIAESLSFLPRDRSPAPNDWKRLAGEWRDRLDHRIDELIQLRDQATGCIGCGCLSMEICALLNPDDEMSTQGPGSRLGR